MTSPAKRYLRPAEAAEYTGRSKSNFDKMRCSGDGPPYSKIGAVVVYDIQDLDAWVEAHRRTSTSDYGNARAGVRRSPGRPRKRSLSAGDEQAAPAPLAARARDE